MPGLVVTRFCTAGASLPSRVRRAANVYAVVRLAPPRSRHVAADGQKRASGHGSTQAWPWGPRAVCQECVQEHKREGCKSRFRLSHPARLTPHPFTYVAKTPSTLAPLHSQTCFQLHQGAVNHGAEGARTPDLLGAIQALSQLSYSPAAR